MKDTGLVSLDVAADAHSAIISNRAKTRKETSGSQGHVVQIQIENNYLTRAVRGATRGR